MKRLFIFLLTVLSALVFAFCISAADDAFVLKIEKASESLATENSKFDIRVTVNDIKAELEGLVSIDFRLNYDNAAFDVESVTVPVVSGWSFNYDDETDGIVKFFCLNDNIDAPITDDGVLTFTVKLCMPTVVNEPEKFTIGNISASMKGDLLNEYEGSSNVLSLHVKTALSTPKNMRWDTSGDKVLAVWDAVDNATSYSVQLYNESGEVGKAVASTTNSYDFTSRLKDAEGGEYSFTVTAVSNQDSYADSKESARCEEPYIVQSALAAPTVTLATDTKNGGLSYKITDNNPSDSRTIHVAVYEKDNSTTPVREFDLDGTAGNIAIDDNIKEGSYYYITAVAKVTDKYKARYTDSKVTKTKNVQAGSKAAAVTSLFVKTFDKTVYTEGQLLDLSGLVITLSFDNETTKDVAFKNFDDYEITTSAENGKLLAVTDNGLVIVVKLGSYTTTLPKLTVNSSDCAHANTTEEHKDANCGEKGYDRVVCSDCGAIVSSTEYPATGEHVFDKWEITVTPTSTLDGQRARTCAVCNHRETEVIPATGNTPATSQTEPDVDTTEPVITQPKETLPPDTEEPDEKGSGMNDLSKIFLIVVIVVFALILLFIVGGTWIDNRRSRARAARMRSRNRSNYNGNNRPRQ